MSARFAPVLFAFVLACAARSPEPTLPAGPDGAAADAGRDDLDLEEAEFRSPEQPVTNPHPAYASTEAAVSQPVATAKMPVRRSRGGQIDVDLRKAGLHNVFRLLAEAGGVNIVVADDVKGTVTLRLRRVHWEQALRAVVAVKKLRVQRDGNLYIIRAGDE